MKRKRCQDKSGPSKKKRKLNVQEKFNNIQNELNQIKTSTFKNDKKIKCLSEKIKTGMNEYLDEIFEKSGEFESGLPKEMIGYHRSYVDIFSNNLQLNVLPALKKMKRDLKIINLKSKQREIKLRKHVKYLQKKLNLKDCALCCELFKNFKRNCSCKTDQHVCIKCIKKWSETKVKEGIRNKFIPCPFCKCEMKNFICPICPPGKIKDCWWCDLNNDLIELKNNFILTNVIKIN